MENATPTGTSQPLARRVLHFGHVDEALADVEALAAAEREGSLRSAGGWTLGQALGHLATWADYAYDGVPLKVPFFVRWAVRPMKKWFLYKPMRAGKRIPGVPGGTLAIERLDTAQALSHFRRSFTRLRDEPPTQPHMFFGPLGHDEWINMHLRHAELHLSFHRAD